MIKFLLSLLFVLCSFLPALNAAENTPYDLFRQGYLSKAAEAYAEEGDKSGKARPYMNASMCLRQAGRTKEAIAMLQKAQAIDPGNAEIHSELGWLKFHSADYAGARQDFEKALSINPELSRAELGLGSAYANTGEKEGMIQHLNAYKQMRPEFAGVDYVLAWNYFNFKMYKEAEEALVSALRKDSTFVEARMSLAGIYTRQKKHNSAWNQYSRVLDVAPNHPIARQMKKKLAGKLSRQPEEIRQPFRIYKPLKMEPVDAVSKLMRSVKLRVGLGTNMVGKQGTNNVLRIKSFNGMTITGKASKKVFANAPADQVWTATFQGGNSFIMQNSAGTKIGPFTGTVILTPGTKNGTIIFEAYKKTRNPWFRNGDRQYRGIIELFPIKNKGIGVVNVIESELYLLGVVPSEVSPQWPYESLKAQAVIARTQILIRRTRGGMHKWDGYHICDGQHCQAYKGKSNESNSTSRAVIDTEGEILTYKNRPAETFFHASCGGWIQASGEVNGWATVPYLTSHDDGDPDHPKAPLDPWDLHLWLTNLPPGNCNDPQRVSPSKYRWMKILRQKDLSLRVNKSHKVGDITEIVPLQRSRAGNVNSIKITGTKGSVTITREHLIRNILGFNSLKSTLFDLEINRKEDGSIRNFWIYGGGWGHGIGLCQSGSASLAGRYGKSYREILNFYFPGTKISHIKYTTKKKKTAPQSKLTPSKPDQPTENANSDSSDDIMPDMPMNLGPSVAPKDDNSINQDQDDTQDAFSSSFQVVNSYTPPESSDVPDFLRNYSGESTILPLRPNQ